MYCIPKNERYRVFGFLQVKPSTIRQFKEENMKKKALCLLLAMIMVLSILAGCTSKPAGPGDQ